LLALLIEVQVTPAPSSHRKIPWVPLTVPDRKIAGWVWLGAALPNPTGPLGSYTLARAVTLEPALVKR
jgi:hypothetical protein